MVKEYLKKMQLEFLNQNLLQSLAEWDLDWQLLKILLKITTERLLLIQH